MQSRFATIFVFSLACTACGMDAPTVPVDDDDKVEVYAPVPWPGHHESPTAPGPDQTRRHSKDATPEFRLEPRHAQQPSRSRWVMGQAVSIQVNVDANGNNIVGDAANEPSMAISPVFPNRIVIGWRQFDMISSDFRQAGWATSGNSGETWNFRGVVRPGTFSSDPVLSVDLEGDFYYYSLQPDRGPGVWACYLYKSTDGGVNWTQDVYGFGGDKAWIAIDRTASEGSGNIYTMWSAFAGCCSGNLFTRSRSGGRTFDNPVPLPENPFAGTLTVARDGTVFVVGSTLQFGGRVPVMRSTNAKMADQAPTFESIAQVSLGGVTGFSSGPNPGGLLGQMWIASDNSEGPFAGNLYLLSSVNPPGSDPLDVMFSRSTNGGLTWSDPIRINSDSFGTNAWQWFGTLSVAPNGRLDVVWYDTRASEDASESQLYYSFSRDGGENWSDDQALSPPFNHSLGYPQQNKLGDYIQTISGVEDLSIAYAATFNGEQDVYFLRIRTLLEECASATAGGFPNRDCNLNGVNDFCDLSNGTSSDENRNFVPDECEEDFDGDGIIDADDSDIDGDGVLNFNDVCDFTPLGALVQDDGRQVGDADQSCSVDLADFELFQTCFSQAGPDAPTPFRFCTEQFSFDPDEDLDLQDWAGFQAAFTGLLP